MRYGKIGTLIVAVMTSIMVAPIFVLLTWSIAHSWPWPSLLPTEFGLRGLGHVFNPGSGALESLFTSLKVSIITMLIGIAISIPAGKALGIYNFRGKSIIKMLVISPLIVSPVAVGMGIHMTFIRLGLANTTMGVVLVHLVPTIPYGIRIITDVFEIVGDQLEQQAKVLGANSLKAFIYITLPIIVPGVISAGSMMFIVSFSQYFLTFLIGGGRVVTFPIMMIPYIQSGDRVMASAYSTVFIATTLLVLYIVEKLIKSYYGERTNYYL